MTEDLGEATDIVQHTGSSVKRRQQGPHVHSVVLDPAGRYVYAADLGLDRVMIYRFARIARGRRMLLQQVTRTRLAARE